ncbi:6024_t:CDS:2, partial [Cetraspora pellucida]
MPFLLLYLQLGAKSELADILSKSTTICNMDLCKCKIAKSTPVSTTSSSTKVNDLTNSLKHLLSAWVDPVMGDSQETIEIVKCITPK